jgi:hypothetical protein
MTNGRDVSSQVQFTLKDYEELASSCPTDTDSKLLGGFTLCQLSSLGEFYFRNYRSTQEQR